LIATAWKSGFHKNAPPGSAPLWERFSTAIMPAAPVEEHREYNSLPQGKALLQLWERFSTAILTKRRLFHQKSALVILMALIFL